MLTEMMATAGAINGFEEGEDGIRCLQRPRTEEDGTLQIDRLRGLGLPRSTPWNVIWSMDEGIRTGIKGQDIKSEE